MELSSRTREDIIEEIAGHIQQHFDADQAKLITAFAKQYFAHVILEDLISREVADLYGLMISHWNLMYQRAPRECKIRIYNPHYEQDGWSSKHTVIDIAHDDMPFLVDSSQLELNRLGLNTHFMIHMGDILLQRNDQHQVTKVLPSKAPVNDTPPEALLHIEIERQINPQILETLRANLLRILGDVRLVVDDWSTMRSRMDQLFKTLDAASNYLDTDELTESKDFLRWLQEDHFIFFGCRDYELTNESGDTALRMVPETGFGLLRNEAKGRAVRPLASLPFEAQQLAKSRQILVISKTNTKSTVHRSGYTDYIGVKQFNAKGEVVGERRFIGLYTSSVYNSNPIYTPFLRHKIALVIQRSLLPPKGHAGKALLNILETLPRDDLFQMSADELYDISLGILHLQERQRIRLFARKDVYGRFYSCMVYVPRDRVDTELCLAMQTILIKSFNGTDSSFSILYSESALTRIHYVIRVDNRKSADCCDFKEIESRLIKAGRSWLDRLRDCLLRYFDERQTLEFLNKYGKAFPLGYRDNYNPEIAVRDIRHIEKISEEQPLQISLYRPVGEKSEILHLRLFQLMNATPLSDVLPILENMGLRVLSERPYKLVFSDKSIIWISDYGMTFAPDCELDIIAIKHLFQEAFHHIWYGNAENDRFNRLVLTAKVSWQETAVLRAYCKYLRQTGFTFSFPYMEEAIAKNAAIAKQLITLFLLRFNPSEAEEQQPAIDELEKHILMELDSVTNLDEDRILRRIYHVIKATLRTNYFQKDAKGDSKTYLSFKFDPAAIPELPLPWPKYEIFVYSPRVEGVHLRGAKVARGGIRWSDRREDFRTEVLGLMKAQQVKNAVIVPSGAKGGFVIKALAADAPREILMDEVVNCYKIFIRGLLDITDNFVGKKIVPPANTVRYDDDDSYLVVAADKGTATFSDIANQLSAEYEFWLGDAFASGGSAGYDHKKMGITAKGAWESVKRHFRELNINPKQEPITVVGIGDMAGDVFGNGMLMSTQLKLVAAFNHQHIFLDPNPDLHVSFAERQRLFNLSRSTWEDYNPELISSGGGVYKRSAKSILLSPAVKTVLQVDADTLEPNLLIQAILKAPVDLLWNGGIGTYVKAVSETNADVGDRANDATRVNGDQLRVKVIAEGGNLGCTQLGRVEYALNNGLIFTDFIDNSAGVDCSDHEVNIKILLNAVMQNDEMNLEQRNQLLFDMTDEVGSLVLKDNYYQTQTLSLAVSQSSRHLDLYRRYIEELERQGTLNRSLEFLPDDVALHERKAQGKGLLRPELAVMLSYAKIDIKNKILKTDIPEDPYLSQAIIDEFPIQLRERFLDQMHKHHLRREIVSTQLTNNLIRNMGILFVYRLQQELDVPVESILRVYAAAEKIFFVDRIFSQIEALDYQLPVAEQFDMMYQVNRLIRRAARWLLRHRHGGLDIAATIEYFSSGVAQLYEVLPGVLSGDIGGRLNEMLKNLIARGVPEPLAVYIAATEPMFSGLDVIDIATQKQVALAEVAKIYFCLGESLELGWLRQQISDRAAQNRWEEKARASLRDTLDVLQCDLTSGVLSSQESHQSLDKCFESWLQQRAENIKHWQSTLADLRSNAPIEFVMFSVALHELQDLM